MTQDEPVHDDHEILVFEEEISEISEAATEARTWRILIVDDDEDVHASTEFSLKNARVLGNGLRFLHAFSAKEALTRLEQDPDIAVLLLDVVMETEDAGLRIIKTIREQMGLQNLRIILRTGQPGQAPEISTIDTYDINDYKTKSELTRSKLYATVTTAIRSYDQLQRLDASRNGLEKIIQATNALITQSGLNAFSAGVITQINSFIGIEAEGVVCVHAGVSDKVDESAISVVAGAGRYEGLMQRSLSAINDRGVEERLLDCLKSKSSHVWEHATTIYFESSDGKRFAAYVGSNQPIGHLDHQMLEVFCNNIDLCAHNVGLMEQLQDVAYVDQLVRLPNRNALLHQVNGHLKSGEAVGRCMAMVDLDQFSAVVDMFGHSYGDEVLQAVGKRLQQVMGDECLVARTAADIFVIYGDPDRVNPTQLQHAMSRELEVGGHEHLVTACLGFVAIESKDHTAEELLKDAGIALKQAKRAGHGQSATFSAKLGDDMRSRASMLNHLRKDFEARRLFLVYQPQLSLVSGEVIGVEALLRWRTESGEMIGPDKFIPLAENSGLIIDIGAWVIEQGLADLERLQQAGYGNICMAVNVSALQFHHAEFLSTVESLIAASPTSRGRLEIEITESCGVLESVSVAKRIQLLKQLGASIAIDDFGTGFSSLSYLETLRADRIKIDRTFVRDLSPGGKAGIASMVVDLGHSLGMKVLAEGAETDTHVAALKELGCDEVQGYFYSKPLPYEELLLWLQQQ